MVQQPVENNISSSTVRWVSPSRLCSVQRAPAWRAVCCSISVMAFAPQLFGSAACSCNDRISAVLCMHACVCVYVCVCMYAWLCVRAFVGVYICVCVYAEFEHMCLHFLTPHCLCMGGCT